MDLLFEVLISDAENLIEFQEPVDLLFILFELVEESISVRGILEVKCFKIFVSLDLKEQVIICVHVQYREDFIFVLTSSQPLDEFPVHTKDFKLDLDLKLL